MGKFSRKIMREHEKGIAFAQRVAEVRRIREKRKKVLLSMGLIAAMNKPDTIVEEAEVKGKKVVRVVEGGKVDEDSSAERGDNQPDKDD